MTAEKVMENLAGMTSQVAPCDVSSIYGIRRAMGIAVPLETSKSFTDLTTGDNTSLAIYLCMWDLNNHLILLVIYFSAGDGWTDGGSAHLLQYTSCHHSMIQAQLQERQKKRLKKKFNICMNVLLKCFKYTFLLLLNKKTVFITLCNGTIFNVEFT